MATNTSTINATELDFDLIKQELITYFKSDPTFQDYEFEGSALNILMDILSYNTHMNAIMANMSANEMFIDSAQVRQNIISIAKSIAYTPRSKRTALAVVDLSFYDILTAPAYITIPAGTRFSSAQGTVFSTKEEYLAYPDPEGDITDYKVTGVEIYEGVFHSFNYVVDYTDLDQKFEIPSIHADTSSLVVKHVVGTVSHTHTLNQDITLATPTSCVYYLHENPNGYFEITFGDDILGRKPTNGSTVSISYIISKEGENANGIDTFSRFQQISGISTYDITTSIKAYGAAEKESKESIAFMAPRMYKAQNRAVITEDYENFMLKEYPFIDLLSVWGGEHNDPPIYGKVFMAIKPTHTEFLSDNLKAKIKDELVKKYNVVTVIPEIVDPTYLYVLVDSVIQFDKTHTTQNENSISNLAYNEILSYFDVNTKKFKAPFYFSNLVHSIDSADQSIANSLTGIRMMMKFNPNVATYETRILEFNNAIQPNSITSSYYNLDGLSGNTVKQYIKDDGEGILQTVNALTGNVVLPNVGQVDYSTGLVEFSITPYSLPPDYLDIRIYCTPQSKNLIPGNRQIILADESPNIHEYGRESGIKVSVTAENVEYK